MHYTSRFEPFATLLSMRVSYSGNTPAFQAGDVSSILSTRSNILCYAIGKLLCYTIGKYGTFLIQLISLLDTNGLRNII